MKNVFIVPTGSNLISKTNINRTLVDGVPTKTIRRFVELEISDDICFVWGCKSHTSGLRNWEAMQKGDLILFYQKKNIQYVAKVIQKFKSKECGDVIWEPDSDHVPFELNYLITQPIKTHFPISTFDGYSSTSVIRGNTNSAKAREQIIRQHGSADAFVDFLTMPTLIDEDTEFEQEVEALLESEGADESYEGSDSPPNKTPCRATSFNRDPAVKANVLKFAHGICDLCTNKAPFINTNGRAYLEVHHVVPLANGGFDQTTNAVALCPNCHRRCHHSIDARKATKKLYEQVKRLKIPD